MKDKSVSAAVPAAVKKPRHPLSVGNVLLGILAFLVLTFIAVYAVAFIMTQSFDFVGISKDMADKLGLTDLFAAIGGWFR